MDFIAFILMLWLIYNTFVSDQIAIFKLHDEFFVSATGNVQLKMMNEQPLDCMFKAGKSPIEVYVHHLGLSTYYDYYYVDNKCNKTIEIPKGQTIQIYNNKKNLMTINCKKIEFSSH